MEKGKLKDISIAVNTSIKGVMQKLNETGEGILFVLDGEGRLIGTVTDGDIRRGIINGSGFYSTVEDIMSREFISVQSSLPEKKKYVKNLMIRDKIEHVPVLDAQGRINDVIVWTDILERRSGERRKYPNTVVIMAGGKGTRMDPFTKVLPKPLIPVGNKPVIELIMERFYKYGFSRFIYTLNYKKEYIKAFLRENNYPYSIDWVEEEGFLGTAGGLSLIKEKIDGTFFVANCDSLLDIDFEDALKWHKGHNAAITIMGCHNEINIPFGVLEISDGKLHKIKEKPVHDVIINTGVYIMEPCVISYIEEGCHLDVDRLIDKVSKKEKVTVYPIYGGWHDMGQWSEYLWSLKSLEGSVKDV